MAMHTNSWRSFIVAAFCLMWAGNSARAQSPAVPQPSTTAQGYRVAGTVVSKVDGHPLARTRITLTDAKAPDKFESLVTSDDGKFEFAAVPAGKYDLHGDKRGYISSSYDQHEQFSTAIVTGAGLETESLVLRLAPSAIISGKVLDEAGDPVRHATVTLYFQDHSSGVDQIRQGRAARTDDQGNYEISGIMPGTKFLSASAKPWYAFHPGSNREGSQGEDSSADVANFDRSLDVAYPLTYYADVTDAESATPIPIRGGERLQVEIHLNPVPSLHLLFRVPQNGTNGYSFPRIEQPAFDGANPIQSEEVRMVSPGLFEISGIPAGRYDVHLDGPGPTTQLKGLDLTKNGEEIDTTTGEAFSSVKVSVRMTGEATLPPQLMVGLRSGNRGGAQMQRLDPKGETEFEQIAPGRYEVLVFGARKPYFISHISAEGAEVSGHSLTVTPGSSSRVSLTVVGGSLNVEGIAKRAGKPFAGAMIVLVPKNPDGNRGLFRRDQSDLDGTFNLQNVVLGSYTVLAIENGWDLDWSQPAIIAAYANRGQTIEVGSQVGHTMNLAEPVDVLSK